MKIKLVIGFLTYVVISAFMSAGAQTATPAPANQNKQAAPADTAYTQQEIAEAKELMLTVPDLRQLSPEVRAKRRASIILSEYIELADNQYKVAITEEKAGKLGVTTDLYKATVAEIEATNKMVAQMMKEGQKIDLPDIQAIMKAYKRGELSLPITM